MKTFYKLLLVGLFISFFSCSKDDNNPSGTNAPEETIDTRINHFIWRGLNAYYLWQSNVPNLSDTRFSNNIDYVNYLNSQTDHNQFFENHLYQRNTVDKWSWIVEDYVALENSFQGISKHNGMEFGLVANRTSSTDIFGYVRYVLPNTDAASKNVERGMIFSGINGTQLTRSNYISLLFSDSDSYTINLANYNNGDPVANGNSIQLNKAEYQENPVFMTKVIDGDNNKKIGYLMYNGFVGSFDGQLNAAFNQLKSSNVTDLVLDLRYNPGGSVRTAIYLASMITGQFNGQVFSKSSWNSKVMAVTNPDDLNNYFTNRINNGSIDETINSLNLDKIVILTTGSTASASELIINGLNPYITVTTIGSKTTGKYAGSITLYDSENLYTKQNVNQEHAWAMQPIVLEIKNASGQNDKDGFDPTIELNENYGALGVLGNVTEPLLEKAIEFINTGSTTSRRASQTPMLSEIYNSKLAQPTRDNMYVELE